MRTLIGIAVCGVLILVLQVTTPYWWWVQAIPLVYGLVRAKTGWEGFGVGAGSAGLLWLLAGAFSFVTGGGIVAARMGRMAGGVPSWSLLIATALVAALAGGLAGAAGCLFRRALRRTEA
jgi:hypothetical protein